MLSSVLTGRSSVSMHGYVCLADPVVSSQRPNDHPPPGRMSCCFSHRKPQIRLGLRGHVMAADLFLPAGKGCFCFCAAESRRYMVTHLAYNIASHMSGKFLGVVSSCKLSELNGAGAEMPLLIFIHSELASWNWIILVSTE